MNIANMTSEQLLNFIAQAELQIERNGKFDEIINTIKQLIDENELDVNAVIKALGGNVSSKSESKKYTIKLGEKTYETSHKKLIKKITDSPEYQQVVQDKPELNVLDTFMRAYSTEYQQDYPFNAVYEGEEFYMNDKGTLNGVSQKHYQKYLKTNSLSDDKKNIQTFKKFALAA
jgi:GTP-sensing pleiotropic transcriptional regulator CodY